MTIGDGALATQTRQWQATANHAANRSFARRRSSLLIDLCFIPYSSEADPLFCRVGLAGRCGFSNYRDGTDRIPLAKLGNKLLQHLLRSSFGALFDHE